MGSSASQSLICLLWIHYLPGYASLVITAALAAIGLLGVFACRRWRPTGSSLSAHQTKHLTELTERKRSEDVLTESQAQLSAIFDNTPVMSLLIDEDAVVLRANHAAVELADRPELQMIGQGPGEALGCVNSTLDVRGCGFSVPCGDCVLRAVVTGTIETGKALPRTEARLRLSNQRTCREVCLLVSSVPILTMGKRLVILYGEDVTDRKQVQDELQRQHDFVSAVIDTAPSLVFVLDREGRAVRFNRACEELTGYSFDEIRGRGRWEALIPPKDRRLVKRRFRDLLTGKGGRTAENHWITRDGRLRLISWANSTLLDSKGNVEFIIATGTDVTDQRRIDGMLHRYQLLSEHARDIILSLKEDGSIIEANDPAVRAYGYTHDELLSLNVADLRVDGHKPSQINGEYSGVLFETMHKRKNGKVFPVEVSSQGAVIGGDRILLCIIRDITERKSAEGNLHMQTSAMNAAGDQIVITNAQGVVEFVNPSFERETGYGFEEIFGRNLRMLQSGQQDDPFYADLWQTISSGKTWQGEIRNKRKDGSLYAEDMTITPVRNEAGNIEHYIAIKRNITDKKVYQETLDHLATSSQSSSRMPTIRIQQSRLLRSGCCRPLKSHSL